MKATRAMLENNTEGAIAFHLRMKPSFRRSLFVVGLLLRFFDFTDPEVIGDQLPVSYIDFIYCKLWNSSIGNYTPNLYV